MAMEAPYLTQLDHALEAGNQILVRGALVGNSFSVNLSTGPDMVFQKPSGDDVALHVQYGRGSRTFVLNSFQGGAWGPEDHCDGSLIQEQVPFEMRIVNNPDRFEVFLNNAKVADFFHRLPPASVRFVYVVGEIALQLVDVGNSGARPPRETAGVHALEKLDPSILLPGSMIVVRGSPTGAKFDINLACGPDMVHQKPTGDDIALHISYSGGSRRIILNSFRGSQWEQETQVDAPSINQGVPFEIRIEILGDRFGVVVNNQILTEFPYRFPPNLIQYVYIVGDINLQSLNYGAKGQGPAPPPGPGPTPTPGPGPLPSVLPVPYRTKLPQNFTPGQKLVIVGTPNPNAAQFQINLYANHLNAFHNLVNFIEKVTYRDSRTRGEDWDKQPETHSQAGFPFVPGKQFQLVYAAEEGAFQVYVDGVHHFTYQHRLPLDKINALGIEGDVQLHVVKYE